MSGHLEEIVCPECGQEEFAEVHHTSPHWTYMHDCICGYTITESEWNNT